jgi:hypothetical protein
MSLPPRVAFALAALLLGSCLLGQVTVKRGAVVYHGSASNTSAPATIDETKVRDATKEWQKIQAEGIDVDSAQGKQLVAQMNSRIREAVKDVATSQSRDMVARSGDITDKQGRDVLDLTDKVVAKL